MANDMKERFAGGGMLIGGLTILALASPALADKWEFEPRLEMTGGYNDNPRLQEGDVPITEITGVELDVLGRLIRRGPTGQFRIDPRVRSSRVPGEENEDFDDFFLDISAFGLTERSRYGISLRTSRQEVKNAETGDPDFDNPDVEIPISDDSGVITNQNNRDRAVIAPFFSYELSEKTSAGLRASYTEVDYERDLNTYSDYEYVAAYADIEFKVGERGSFSFDIDGSQYESKNFFNKSDSIGAGITLARDFSESLNGSVSVGVSEVENEVLDQFGQSVKSSDTANTFSLNLSKRGEISRLVFNVQQSVDPSGDGGLRKRLQLRFRYSRSLSPVVTGTFDARWQDLQDAIGNTGRFARDYFRIKTRLSWRLSRVWSLIGDYTLTKQDFDSRPGDATSNSVSLGFLYEPKRRR